MRQEYQRQYKSEVDVLAASGFEMHLLSGQALRDLSPASPGAARYAMPPDVQALVVSSCNGRSLALSSHSAARLAERNASQEALEPAKISRRQFSRHDS
ncbi:hypothetical protein [Marinobacter nauticus]|uniref:Uncharacterized protein n=1 Tax=Marinobacter nauticus TaxID=2743 RepID=A0A1M2UWW6_MARNT|nr:hypothetical protein [Marinobacter nauticus]OJS99824.1 hypothetical protein BEE62_06815 [Marinobacter nauticus]